MTAKLAASGASEARLQGIHALRGVAAMLVVVYHATVVAVDRSSGIPATPVWNTGQAGVDIFFAISGLVMGFTYYRQNRRSWSEFLKRRLIRIVPMYWLATSLKLGLMLAVPVFAIHSRFVPWHVLASYLFIPAKNADGTVYPLLWVGWTLSFEMLFYALFALALALRAPLLSFLAPVLTVLALVGLARTHDWPAAAHLLDPLLLEFLGGLVLAWALSKGFNLRRVPSALLLLCAVATLLLVPGTTYATPARALLWGVPALAIVTVGATARWSPPALMLKLGDASYSIYLAHAFVMTLLGIVISRVQPHTPLLVLCLLASIASSAAVGVLSYTLVEAPMLRGLNRWAFARAAAGGNPAKPAAHRPTESPLS